MSPPLPPAEPAWHPRAAAAALVLAALLAWANSFSGPFVFDDRPAILANPTLDRFATALSPPRDGGTVAGRPLVNLSLAVNRALSGTNVGSYHAANLLIHVLAGLTLFELVRRTLGIPKHSLATGARPPSAADFSPPHPGATAIAFSAALLWLLHPLQTAAVTYVVQRAESLMALCFLLTLYFFVRGCRALSVLACLAGMGCKEVMAVAPLVVLLYDRTFCAGTFAAALRQRWRYYLALGATWLPLAWLVARNASRSGTAGFLAPVSSFDYALTQCGAIIRYLGLALWPGNLVFDYGTSLATSLASVWPQALLLLGLLAATLLALRHAPVVGFFGAAFFLILAPSSSIVPVATQTIAEHRMYLPLAVLAVGAALGLQHVFQRRALVVAVVLALPLGVATARRNEVYRDALTLWTDTVRKRPDSSRAHNNAGILLAQAGRHAEAVAHYETALRLAPADAGIRNNLANALTATGRAPEALPHYEESVRLQPASIASRLNLARALASAGRPGDALPHYAAAEQLGPLDADAHTGFAAALAATGRAAEATPHYERALQIEPGHASAHYHLGLVLAGNRRYQEAAGHFRATTLAEPANVAARVNLGNVLLLSNRPAEAIVEYEAALRLKPDDRQIRANLGRARQLLPR